MIVDLFKNIYHFLLALEELCATVKVEKNGEVLTLPTLRKFFDALAMYVSQTFCQLIDDYRTGIFCKKL